MDTGLYCGFEVALSDTGVATVTFNRPERLNAMTRSIKRDFVEMLQQAQMDERVRVLVFTGAGKGFVAGDDISGSSYGADAMRPSKVPPLAYGNESPQLRTYDSLRTLSQMVARTIRHVDKLTVCAINGFAIQVGLSIALACDFRIAARGARLGSATLRFGYLPDEGGHWLLVQHLGVARALDFLLKQRIVDADEALALGIVNEVVEPEQLADRAREFAEELARGPQVAMRLLKKAVYNAADQSLEQAGEDVAAKTAIVDHHPDAREGRLAFKEERAPRFNRREEGGHG
jgi:2-(1,2-epoxy-1,2-dihydrophenyl)acetyl-CoA isomerase